MIYEVIKYKTIEGRRVKTTYVDGDNLRDVLEAMEAYQEEYYATDGLYGYHEDEFVLRVRDEDDNETDVDIIIKCQVERPIDEQREYGTLNKAMQGVY